MYSILCYAEYVCVNVIFLSLIIATKHGFGSEAFDRNSAFSKHRNLSISKEIIINIEGD